jgi:hypothetical protein
MRILFSARDMRRLLIDVKLPVIFALLTPAD